MSFFNKLFKKKSKEKTLQEIIKSEPFENIKNQILESNVNIKDKESNTPLYYAVLYQKEEAIDYLLSLGARIDALDESPTKLIFRTNNINILNIFLKHSFVLPSFESNIPLIHLAVELNCSKEFIEVLMQNGAQLEDYKNKSALQKAISLNCSFELIEYLIKLDGKVFSLLQNKTNLLEDVLLSPMDNLSKIRVIKELKKQKNININAKTSNEDENETALELAIKLKQPMIVKELLLLGADFSSIIDKLNFIFEVGDLDEIIETIKLRDIDLVELFSILTFEKIDTYLKTCKDLKGTLAILNIIDNPKLTQEEKIQLIEQALKKGANVNEKDKKRETTALLNYCKNITENTNDKLVKFLIYLNARIEDFNQSALFFAIKNYNLEIVDLLLENKADVNFIDKDDKSVANHLVKVFKRSEEWKIISILKKLLKYNLDLNTKSKYFTDSKGRETDMFCIFIISETVKTINFLLEENLKIDKSSWFIFYAVRFLPNLELQKKLIALNPEYKHYDFYQYKEKREYAEAIGLAINYDNEPLVEYLLETYPDMKTHSAISMIHTDIIEKGFKVETIKKLILRDPDINRRYFLKNDDQEYSITNLIDLAKKIVDDRYSKKDIYFEILEFLLQNGADANAKEEHIDEEVDSLSIFSITADTHKVNEKLYDLLIKYGGNPKEKSTSMDESSIHAIAQRLPKLTDDSILSHLQYFDKKVGINLEERNKLDTNLFLAVAMNCKPKTLQWLIDKGANISDTGGFDNAPAIHKTICNYGNRDAAQRAKTVEVLIKAGVDFEKMKNNHTPLMMACYYGAYLSVKILLENSANPNNKNRLNETAINFCVSGNYSYDSPNRAESTKSRIIYLLKEYGANIDNSSQEGTTPLILAIKENKKEIFETLLKVGADINFTDNSGVTPLMYAISYGNIYFVNKLLNEPHIDINKKDEIGANALYYTIYRYNQNEGIQIFEELIKKDSIEIKLENNDTLLHKACEVSNYNLIPTILKYTKYDINSKNEDGFSALIKVIISNYDISEQLRIKTIKLLIDNDIDLNVITSQNETIFHILLQLNLKTNSLNLYFELLCKYGADINYNKNIDSPLLYFVKNMQFVSNRSMGFLTSENKVKKDEDEIVDMLLKNGANLQLALEEAEENELSKEITDYLKTKES